MPDLSELTHEHFISCLNQTFEGKLEENSAFQLELAEVETKGSFDPEYATRQAFSVIFRGPQEPVLTQHTYTLHNENLGTLEIFLVPIGPDEKGMRYEALFT